MKESVTRLEPLTGLRGVAACSVLISHAVDTSFNYGGVSIFHLEAERLAYFGMSLFFVLSGFVIEYNYADSFAVGPLGAATYRFFVARFARLYPLYLLSIICVFAYIPHPYFTRWVTLSYLTLTQSWFNMEIATFPPDWSISTEWFFYFAFIPLTMVLSGLRHPRAALVIFCATATVGLMVVFHFWIGSLVQFTNLWFWHDEHVSAGAVGWIYYFCPGVRLFEFIAGVLAAKCYRMRKSGGPAPIFARVIMLLALVWCGAVIDVNWITAKPIMDSLMRNFIFAPALALLMLNLCQYESLLSRLLASRPAVFLGEISYSIYIWSFSALTLMVPYYQAPEASVLAYANSIVKMAAIFTLTIVFAYGSYALIEVPSRRKIRKLLAGGVPSRVQFEKPKVVVN
jgi:peptidoglycan/LPS O-acetylase OafA/YrhL